MSSDRCPVYSTFFAAMGAAVSIIFCCFGASYGMAKSGVGVVTMGISRPDMVMRNILPIILASVISIYGLVVSVLISNQIVEGLALYTAFIHLAAGLAVGLSGLASGFGIGIIGDAGVRAVGLQPRLYVSMALILIFTEVLGLYGMIIALLMLARGNSAPTCY